MLGMHGLDGDFVFHLLDAREILHGVLGEGLVVPVLHGAGQGDDTIAGLHLDVVLEDRAVVVGCLGGILDFAVGGGRGEQGDGPGDKYEKD